VDELTSIGARDVRLTNGAVLATIPATVEDGAPTIGFLVPLHGPDDNAGAAVIMTVAGYLLHHPHLRHGPIRIGFASDEEIGRGVHRHLPADLDAAVIYTFKADQPRSHRAGSVPPRQYIRGGHGLSRVEQAARAVALCVAAVSLVD
jgi:di/tripeptidase